MVAEVLPHMRAVPQEGGRPHEEVLEVELSALPAERVVQLPRLAHDAQNECIPALVVRCEERPDDVLPELLPTGPLVLRFLPGERALLCPLPLYQIAGLVEPGKQLGQLPRDVHVVV